MSTKIVMNYPPAIFEIEEENKLYRFPVIQILNFSKDVIYAFDMQEAPVPLFLELNLAAPCQMACKYCFTESATPLDKRTFKLRDVDKHALLTSQTKPLSVVEISTAMLQFSRLGGKVIFLCSEGEVILEKKACLYLAQKAKEMNLGIIFYTNMKALNEDYAMELRNLGVNLSCKLESLDPKVNNLLIPSKTSSHSYKYIMYKGKSIPEQLHMLINVYRDNLSMLGLSTTMTALNASEIVNIREFAYVHGMQHMIKGLHFDGYAYKNNKELNLDANTLGVVESKIKELNAKYGYSCPKQDYGGGNQHAYDIRTWLNVRRSRTTGMFAKVITNQAGAFADVQGEFVSVRDEYGMVNLGLMFKKMSELGRAKNE